MCIHTQTFHDTYQYYYMIAPVVLVCIVYVFARILVCICSYSVAVYVFGTYLSVLRFWVTMYVNTAQYIPVLYLAIFYQLSQYRPIHTNQGTFLRAHIYVTEKM